MKIAKLAAAAAVLSLATAPAVAQAAPAAERSSQAVSNDSDLAGHTGLFVAILALLLVIGFAAGTGHNAPMSP